MTRREPYQNHIIKIIEWNEKKKKAWSLIGYQIEEP